MAVVVRENQICSSLAQVTAMPVKVAVWSGLAHAAVTVWLLQKGHVTLKGHRGRVPRVQAGTLPG